MCYKIILINIEFDTDSIYSSFAGAHKRIRLQYCQGAIESVFSVDFEFN